MSKDQPEHPGPRIKRDVLPPDLSVSAAAKQLQVGRPALSNLLNGKASLSADMATRLAKTFGADKDNLLKMQTDYDRSRTRDKEAAIAVRTYVAPIVNIRASQIEAWAEGRLEVRAHLAALLRRLVISTGDALTRIDFPAYENSQRQGPDGFLMAEAATPWIPLGQSIWEFGVDPSPAKKAEEDYAARLESVDSELRRNSTFIFVTPRNWRGKDVWANKKKALEQWRDVRAYDASDLEQWLESSIPAQAWMAEQLSVSGSEVYTLEACWRQWAEVMEPPASKLLFTEAVKTLSPLIAHRLSNPVQAPMTVVANSDEEALAALACILDSEDLRPLGAMERAIVVKSAKGLSQIAKAKTDFILVIASPDAERASAGLHRQQHTFIVTRRDALEDDPDIFLDVVGHEAFRSGLKEMGLDDDGVDRLGRESGRSLTVLRRRLSAIPDIKRPPWAADKNMADRLIPLVLVGAWNASSEADQAVLAGIAAGTHDEIEFTVADLIAREQSPVWAIEKHRGVTSKIDALYAVRSYVTPAHLRRFFDVARIVLSENDPSLDLPEDKRWMANLYGKSRRHSGALRQGLCETLVLLAAHGDNLFRSGLSDSTDVEAKVNQLIRSLLTPLNQKTWQSQRHDLPRYAEAAPEVFLDILEQDLASPDPKVYALMQPAGEGGFSSPGRTGLLWALEVLAWNPQWLSRTVVILGKLAEINISDNWANRPDNSLESIFRAWMPQTAATLEQRIGALELLIRRSPKVGWEICIDQFNPFSTVGHYTQRPRWRAYARGFGEPRNSPERGQMVSKALQLAVGWQVHTAQTLGDLVDRLGGIAPDEREAVWAAIETWIAAGPDESSKAELRERIRKATLTRRGRSRGMESKQRIRAKKVYDALEPTDLIARHQWLFAKQWVEESAEEIADEKLDYDKREERISRLRQATLREIWNSLGYAGISHLCRLSEAPWMIGWHLAADVLNAGTASEFVAAALADGKTSRQHLDKCLSGMLFKLSASTKDKILSCAIDRRLNGEVDESLTLRLLGCAPFGSATWALVDRLPISERELYWREISPIRFHRDSEEDVTRAVDELLKVDRPRAAFHTIEMEFSKLDSDRLVRLLVEAATKASEPEGHYRLERYHISEAFEELSKRNDVSPDMLARLEFLYIDALDDSEHGIKNLERQLSQAPELFVYFLSLVFKRKDGGADLAELRPRNLEHARALATSAFRLLSDARRTPGTDEQGKIDPVKLRDWIKRVRELSRECGREEISETYIGQLLGRSAKGGDDIWPNEAIRNVLEELGTSEMANGMRVGLFNDRGMVWRGKGGAQERELAEKYRSWAKELEFKYPFSARLLNDMARGYDRDAEWHDKEFQVRDRLQDG